MCEKIRKQIQINHNNPGLLLNEILCLCLLWQNLHFAISIQQYDSEKKKKELWTKRIFRTGPSFLSPVEPAPDVFLLPGQDKPKLISPTFV